jgi:hypothetical protein
MKEQFREIRMNKANSERLVLINSIIEEYAEQGYTLTLRQLYYQLVSKNIIANKEREYKNLGTLLVKGRMAGIVDWENIEDRIRVPFIPYYVSGITNAIDDTIDQYRLDRMKNQDVYIELWVEKDAISGVMKRITSHYHINLMVNRGYSSASAMYDAYNRLQNKAEQGKEIVILYLGDHDPSGLDMIRDIKKRLTEFGAEPEVKHIAITTEQVREYKPPPNPAKLTDSRSGWYISKYGRSSWEVDALKPEILNKLVREAIEELIDIDRFKEMLEKEKKDKDDLKDFRDKNGEDDDDE